MPTTIKGHHDTIIVITQSNTSLLSSGSQINLLQLSLGSLAPQPTGRDNGNHYGQLKH